jgi:hypothetical protein
LIPTKKAANRIAILLNRQPGAYIQQYANMVMLVKETGSAAPIDPRVFADLRPYLREGRAGRLVLDPRKVPAPKKSGPHGPRPGTTPSVHRAISLPTALAAALAEKARRDGVPVSGLMLAACEAYRHESPLVRKRVGGTKTHTVRFPIDLATRMEGYALEDGVAFSTVVTAAVRQMLKGE